MRPKSVIRLLALLLTLGLVAGACGGDDDAGEATEETDEAGSDGSATDGGDDDVDDDPGGTDGAAMAPRTGGELVSLLEAETDTWDIPGSNCAVSCITVMRAVADPLTIVNADGEVEPFLLESFSSNEDFTEWTLVMRDGVTFHDGTPADGAAVQRSLQEMARGILLGQVLVDLADGPDSIVLTDPMTVTVTFATPFAVFTHHLAERIGWLIAPSYWDASPRAGALMVATGPFEMTEWTKGEQTVVERNGDYWRTDEAGTQLPYLDRIVFRPNPDVSARRATMAAGDADVNMDSFAENASFWQTDWLDDGNSLIEPGVDRETTYLMLNTSAPPFDDPDLRRALALCTDRDEYLTFRSPGNELANGPFAEGSLGYLADTGYPEFDPAAGNALLDEIGRPEVIEYGTTDAPSNLETAQLFADIWADSCGLDVVIDQFDQSELITRALTGNYEILLWRNHGQIHPGMETVWWHSRHAQGLALNFNRIDDPVIDEALLASLATDDRAELDALGQEMSRAFGTGVYNVWLDRTAWMLPVASDVHGVGHMTLESGNPVQPTLAGRVWLQEAWKEG